MSLVREQDVFLMQVADLIRKAHDLGLVVTAGELYRTPEQQAIYVRTGRSKTKQSQHLKRLAIDLNFFERAADGALRLIYDSPAIRRLGTYWESLDPANRWGGNWTTFRDVPHFERREGVARAPPSPPHPLTPAKNSRTATVSFLFNSSTPSAESLYWTCRNDLRLNGNSAGSRTRRIGHRLIPKQSPRA